MLFERAKNVQKEHTVKRKGSRMPCFCARPSQRGKKVTRERQGRERRKFWTFWDIEGHKNTQKRTRNTHAHIFEKVRPPILLKNEGARPTPIFENGRVGDQPRNPPAPSINGGAMRHCTW